MKIGTMSIVIGGKKCNAKCPFCISKMTPNCNVKDTELPNWQKNKYYYNLQKACRFAEMKGVTTVLLTGKGEPTLYPEEIANTLQDINKWNFPFIELQTNGLKIAEWIANDDREGRTRILDWLNLGMTTIILSIVHYEDDRNAEIYRKPYMNLEKTIDKLHKLGFSVRLSCIMMKMYIAGPFEIQNLIRFAKKNEVEQLTIRPVSVASDSVVLKTDWGRWALAHKPDDQNILLIHKLLKENGHKLMSLSHGAEVFDYEGQNICLSNCLTIEPETDNLRQIIVFPDGKIRYDWNYEGAILL